MSDSTDAARDTTTETVKLGRNTYRVERLSGPGAHISPYYLVGPRGGIIQCVRNKPTGRLVLLQGLGGRQMRFVGSDESGQLEFWRS